MKIARAERPPVLEPAVLEDPSDGRRDGCARRRHRTRLVDQRAAGQAQEDVLERRPADEDRLGLEPALVDRDRGRLAVVGVEQDPVGQVLDPLGEAVELAVERLLDRRAGSAAR